MSKPIPFKNHRPSNLHNKKILSYYDFNNNFFTTEKNKPIKNVSFVQTSLAQQTTKRETQRGLLQLSKNKSSSIIN